MAFPESFIELLADPEKGTALKLSNDQLLISDSGVTYKVKDRLAILLPQQQQNADYAQYQDHYQKDAEIYDYTEEIPLVEKEESRRLHQYILAKLPHSNWTLDVGCGKAWLAQALTQRGQKVISMDISDVNPQRALQNFPSPHHFGLVADVYHLPFQNNSLDTIVASEIIEHVTDPKGFIAQLLTALKPGGKLIITTPYNEYIRTTLCIHCNKETPYNAHLHSFDERKIKSIIPNSVQKVNVQLLNSKALVHTRIQRLLRFLPLGAWAIVDKMAIYATRKKACRMLVEVVK